MIQNIIFDMGNVLIAYDPKNMIDPFVSDPGDHDLIRRAMFESEDWKKLDRGDITDGEALEGALCRLPSRLHPAMRDIFRDWHRHYLPIAESVELVKSLQSKGYKTYLLSNASLRWYDYYCGYEALRLLDGYVISAKEHAVKPEAKIYQVLFDRFHLKPEECFFVDDLPANVEGGRRCGMDGFALTSFQYGELKKRLRDLGVSV